MTIILKQKNKYGSVGIRTSNYLQFIQLNKCLKRNERNEQPENKRQEIDKNLQKNMYLYNKETTRQTIKKKTARRRHAQNNNQFETKLNINIYI